MFPITQFLCKPTESVHKVQLCKDQCVMWVLLSSLSFVLLLSSGLGTLSKKAPLTVIASGSPSESTMLGFSKMRNYVFIAENTNLSWKYVRNVISFATQTN